MDHLDGISIEELQNTLNNVGEEASTTALSGNRVQNGVTQTELAEWYDVQQRTIYSWLKRFNTDESLEHAVTDTHRSERKRKLSETEQTEFEEPVHESPENVGFDAPAWTPALAQRYFEESYDVEYSIPVAGS